MHTYKSALSLRGVSKEFDSVKAVNGLSWELEPGKIYGLLGQNGAGKTTALRMVLAILLPDAGEIEVFGEPLRNSHQRLFGYLPEERGLYRRMRVRDLLVFFGKIRGLPAREANEKSAYWLKRLELAGKADSKISELSRGMQQKIQFIIAVMHAPRILILDEPFQGLDPVNADVFRDIILEQKRSGITVILSTHIMEHAEKLCDNICLIHEGTVKLEGSLSRIRQDLGRNTVKCTYEGDGGFFRSLPDIDSLSDSGGSVELVLKEGADPSAILAEAVRHVRVTGFEIKGPSLHEIFVHSVAGGRETAAGRQ